MTPTKPLITLHIISIAFTTRLNIGCIIVHAACKTGPIIPQTVCHTLPNVWITVLIVSIWSIMNDIIWLMTGHTASIATFMASHTVDHISPNDCIADCISFEWSPIQLNIFWIVGETASIADFTAFHTVVDTVWKICNILPAVWDLLKELNASPTFAPTSNNFGAICWIAGINPFIKATLALFNIVLIGAIVIPSSACFCATASCDILYSLIAFVFSSYICLLFPYDCIRVSFISLALSWTVLVPSNFALKSSSLTPAQFRASARFPVTLDTWAVSFMDSVSPSIGIESPYLVHTAVADSKVFCISFTLNPIPVKLDTAFVAIISSPV